MADFTWQGNTDAGDDGRQDWFIKPDYGLLTDWVSKSDG